MKKHSHSQGHNFCLLSCLRTEKMANNTTSELGGIIAIGEEAVWLMLVVAPVLLLLGSFGSVMTIVVMRSLTSGQSITVYFTALAVSDLLVLIIILPNWCLLHGFRINIRQDTFTCKLHMYLSYVLPQTSSWFLVAMTCHRVTSVLWPLNVTSHSPRRAHVVVGVMTTVLVVINAYVLVTVRVIYRNNQAICTFPFEDEKTTNKFLPWIQLCLSSLFPFIILAISNVILVWKIHQSAKKARTMTGEGQSNARRKKASSLTVTVVITSVVFFVLTMPFPVYNKIMLLKWDGFTGAFLILVWYLNCAVNFYLYCLTGSKFRNVAKEKLTRLFPIKCFRLGKAQSDTTQTVNTRF